MCVCIFSSPSGTRFKRIIPDQSCTDAGQVERLIFCSGKVYYELAREREKLGLSHKAAIVRVEQVGGAYGWGTNQFPPPL